MKITNVIASIIAIIAIIGDVFFMYVLLVLGESMKVFTEIGGAEMLQIGQTLSLAFTLGWIWSILVLVSGLFVLKFALLDQRKKAK